METLKPYLSNEPWRQKFWEAAVKKGLPTKKWDPFKYVSLKGLYKMSFEKKEGESTLSSSECAFRGCISKESGVDATDFMPNDDPIAAGAIGEECGTKDVVPTSALLEIDPLNACSSDGIISLPLDEAMGSYGSLLQKRWTEALGKEQNPFALLSHALYQEGRFLYIPPGKVASLNWEFFAEEGAFYAPKMEIFLGKGARLVLERRTTGKGSYFYNEHIEVTLDEGAHVTLNAHREHEGYAMHTLRAHLKRDAKLDSFTFSKGAPTEREDIEVTLGGENSEVDLKGLSIVGSQDEVHQFINVRHVVPHCRSNQHYKTALYGRGRSSFEGKIYVEKEAQKTEAYQLNNNLLLSSKAQAMSKPNLEIFADDVKASHGATCAQPKEEELFYLRTRGLSLEEARGHLARGFCAEMMDGKVVDQFLQIRSSDGSI
ncbi:SufB/SufD family protein [Candidatus Neptunochlamydia vexilliferae]|uniref:SufB/SufD family protein n=1 Tax=Candidatus Neptunichlamydia vexilliferae TaxID=1651774 RepID=UPI001891F076|nr:SufD family Fe-S cluster assembly protein [Candidatus Neptunochlamydia vexilliferae]